QLETSAAAIKSGGKALTGWPVSAVSKKDDFNRLASGISEVDTVLGGGFVAGSVNLISGQPGIGKSTILLQIANRVAKKADVLYVSGEESAHQVGLRAKRLGVNQAKLQITTSNSADDIASTINSADFKLVIVDSIQTVSVSAVASSAGNVSQITGSTQLL